MFCYKKHWTFIELDIQSKGTGGNETLPEKPVLLSARCSLFPPSHTVPLLNPSWLSQLTQRLRSPRAEASGPSGERENRRDAACRELSNEIGQKYCFVPVTAEGYFVSPGFTRHPSTVKRFWNLLIIQTSCISQL